MSFGGQNVYFTRGLSSNSDRNTLMPSTMDVRSFGSMRIQSSSNHRFTASNCATLVGLVRRPADASSIATRNPARA